MNFLVKNAQGEILKLTVVSGLPQLPDGMELVGSEELHNPNGNDLATAKLELQEIEASYDVLVSPEILAQAEVPYQAAVVHVPAIPEVVAVAAQPEKWIKEGEVDVLVDPSDVTWTHVNAVAEVVGVPAVAEVLAQDEVPFQAAVPYVAAVYNTIPAVMRWMVVLDSVKSNIKSQTEAIAVAYGSMNDDIYAQMALVFGTTNVDSANAYNATWQLMKDQPLEFVGTQFANEAAVLAYVNPKLVSVLAYAKMRLARIKQFQDEKAAILA